MALVIRNAGLSFGSLQPRATTNRIIVHHAEAKAASPEDIHRWHLGNGWSGAGYHFYVRKDGSVWALRPEGTVGAHAQGSNSDSIGVCFEGDYNVEDMPAAQLSAGIELLDLLKKRYGIGKVQRHRDVYDTDCPGARFPFDDLCSGKAASMNPNVQIWTAHTGDQQRWKPVWVDKAAGVLSLKSKSCGKYLDIEGGKPANGANVCVAPKSGKDSQKFVIVKGSGRFPAYGIAPFSAQGMRLDCAKRSTDDGANVQIWDDNGDDNQKWGIFADKDGYVRVVGVASSKALDVYRGGK